jgi:hypothetical protein
VAQIRWFTAFSRSSCPPETGRIDFAGGDAAVEIVKGYLPREDRSPQIACPAAVAIGAIALQRSVLVHVRADEQGSCQCVDAADVGIEQVRPGQTLSAELRIEVESAG